MPPSDAIYAISSTRLNLQVEAGVADWARRTRMDMTIGTTRVTWTILGAGDAMDDKIHL